LRCLAPYSEKGRLVILGAKWPGAALSLLGENVESFVVVLSDPELKSGSVSYEVVVEDGTIPRKFEEASLFIDNNLWAAVGGHMARRSQARAAAAYQAGQQSGEQTAQQDQNTYYQAHPPAPAASAAPTSATATPEQELHQLKQMLDKGLITQTEYDDKKKEILAAL